MEQQYFNTNKKFELELGGHLDSLTICYNTYGTLNPAKDNVIWVVHALTANSEVHDWWGGLFGDGKIFDPTKYFIVCANNLGSPYGSSSANSINPTSGQRYGMGFPDFTLRDTADAFLLLLKELQIKGIHLLMGGSCGGNIALEMAYILGSKIDHLCLLCCSAKESPWTIGIHQTQRNVIERSPAFHINQEKTAIEALETAREIALPYYRTAHSINKKQADEVDTIKDFKVVSYLHHQGKKFSARFDTHCYYTLLNALDTYNIGRGRGSVIHTLENIKIKALCIAINTDLFIPPYEQQYLSKHLPNATYKEVDSIYGHDAFLIEKDQINAIVEAFLNP